MILLFHFEYQLFLAIHLQLCHFFQGIFPLVDDLFDWFELWLCVLLSSAEGRDLSIESLILLEVILVLQDLVDDGHFFQIIVLLLLIDVTNFEYFLFQVGDYLPQIFVFFCYFVKTLIFLQQNLFIPFCYLMQFSVLNLQLIIDLVLFVEFRLHILYLGEIALN